MNPRKDYLKRAVAKVVMVPNPMSPNWKITKACACVGESVPGFPVPICAVCGRPWRLEAA